MRARPPIHSPGVREKLIGVANLCAPYSAVGALFMFWVGTMISKQSFLIVGLQDVGQCKNNAYGAMWMFIFNFSVCIVYLAYVKNIKSQWDNVDQDEGRPMLPPGMTDYVINPEIELSTMPPYRDEVSDDVDTSLPLPEDGELIDLNHDETRELI